METKRWYEHWKGGLEVVRDGAILGLFAALLINPLAIKDRLTKAGFTKGSFAGLEWEAALQHSVEEVREATSSVATLEKQLEESRAELIQLRTTPGLPADARDRIVRLGTKFDTTAAQTT